MTHSSDGSYEAEQLQLAAQAHAGLLQRVKLLETRCTDLQHQVWAANQDNAQMAAQIHTLFTILSEQGSLAAQSVMAYEQAGAVQR